MGLVLSMSISGTRMPVVFTMRQGPLQWQTRFVMAL